MRQSTKELNWPSEFFSDLRRNIIHLQAKIMNTNYFYTNVFGFVFFIINIHTTVRS